MSVESARVTSSGPLSLKEAAKALGVAVTDIETVILCSESMNIWNFNVVLRRGVKWLGKKGEQVAFPVNKGDLRWIRGEAVSAPLRRGT